MAHSVPKYILKNCTIYTNRENRIGQASEIVTPAIELKTDTFLNAGMIKEREVIMGVMTALTLGFKETAFDGDVISLIGKPDVEYMVVGALRDADGGNPLDAVIYCRGEMKKFDGGTWQAGEKSESDYEIAAQYIKLQIADNDIFEVDDFEFKVGGETVFGYADSMING